MDDVKRYLDKILVDLKSKKNNHTHVGNNVNTTCSSSIRIRFNVNTTCSSSIRIRFFQTLMLLLNKIFA